MASETPIVPNDPRAQFGRRGEDLASLFFRARGFRVLDRNWRTRLGEIDLIVEKDGRVHFIEVKTRRSTAYGNPEEAITQTKLRHLSRTIELYLRAHPAIRHYQAGALAILTEPRKPAEFHYIEQIF